MVIRSNNDVCHLTGGSQLVSLYKAIDMTHFLITRLPFENRLIRFLLFDLFLGFELSGMEMPETLKLISGFVAIYLLITSLIGRCPVEGLVRYVLKDKDA